MGIATTIIIISSIILIIYIFSKVGHNSAEFFDGSNYKDFTSNNKNLDNILQSFSKLAYKPNSELKNISNSYILTKNNLDTPLKQEVESVITKVLDKINSIYSTKYKLTDLERIKVETNILRETQVSIIFFIYEVDKYSARKVFIQYRKSSNGTSISHIRTVQSGNDDFKQSYVSADYHNVGDKFIIDERLNLPQQNCQGNLKLYTASEHKVIDIKLNDNCTIKKMPKHMARPFVNPTMFEV